MLLIVVEIVVEFVKNFVDIHDLIDIFLFLLDLSTLLIDVVFGVGKVLNSLRSFHHLVFHEAERGRKLDGVIFGDRGNQLDLFLTDLLILGGVGSPNIFAVDEEHADLDLDGDALKELVFVLDLLEDVAADLLRGSGGLALTLFGEFGDILVGVEIIFSCERLVGLDILVEGLNRSVELDDHILMERGIKPGVLIEELSFVHRIRRQRLVRRNDWSLNLLHVLGFEELFEQELLKVRNLLKALDTILENFFDLFNDLSGVVVVLRDKLVGLTDQIKLEQRIGVLVARELLVNLTFDFESPGKFILTHRKVTIGLLALFV